MIHFLNDDVIVAICNWNLRKHYHIQLVYANYLNLLLKYLISDYPFQNADAITPIKLGV